MASILRAARGVTCSVNKPNNSVVENKRKVNIKFLRSITQRDWLVCRARQVSNFTDPAKVNRDQDWPTHTDRFIPCLPHMLYTLGHKHSYLSWIWELGRPSTTNSAPDWPQNPKPTRALWAHLRKHIYLLRKPSITQFNLTHCGGNTSLLQSQTRNQIKKPFILYINCIWTNICWRYGINLSCTRETLDKSILY